MLFSNSRISRPFMNMTRPRRTIMYVSVWVTIGLSSHFRGCLSCMGNRGALLLSISFSVLCYLLRNTVRAHSLELGGSQPAAWGDHWRMYFLHHCGCVKVIRLLFQRQYFAETVMKRVFPVVLEMMGKCFSIEN